MYIPYYYNLVPRARSLRRKQTRAETIFWEAIRGKKYLGLKFTRQKPLYRYIVDFYCAELKLAIEIDGSSHYGSEKAAQDRFRTNYLKDRGIKIRRYTNEEVINDIDLVLENLKQYIAVYQIIGE